MTPHNQHINTTEKLKSEFSDKVVDSVRDLSSLDNRGGDGCVF